MKLSHLIVGGAALLFAAGQGVSAMAADSAAATFNVTGHVKDTCLIHFSSHSLALGDIAIDNTASDPATSYFHLINGPLFESQTGTGGCNDNNDITITKTNGAKGLHNTSTAKFDPTVFTADIPYEAAVNWTGIGEGGSTVQLLALEAQTNQASATTVGIDDNGPFASAMTVFINVPAPSQGLIAGDYTDTVTVTLQTI
jgi:hypothetical protein